VARKTATEAPKQLRITQVRSLSGRPEKHRKTMEALGFKHHQQTVIQKDNAAIRGMIFQVQHLVSVEEVAGGEA
jgi:large subunit ribosomal protein L30